MAPFAAGFLARSTVLRDLGMTGFWAMKFLGLFYGLNVEFPSQIAGRSICERAKGNHRPP